MTTLRTAAQQALEALEYGQHTLKQISENQWESRGQLAMDALKAALAEPDYWQEEARRYAGNADYWRKRYESVAEPVQDTGVKLKPVFYAPRRLDDEEIEAIVGKPVQEPPCATRECMPSECPNCVSLQDQNTELDQKLADIEQTSLELCNVCGWKTLIPDDCCLNCERKHPLGQASTDVPLTVYSVKKAEPVQEPVAWLDEEINCAYTPEELDGGTADGLVPLFTAPPQRKPLTEEEIEKAYREIWRDLPSDFDHTSSGWIEMGIRYAER